MEKQIGDKGSLLIVLVALTVIVCITSAVEQTAEGSRDPSRFTYSRLSATPASAVQRPTANSAAVRIDELRQAFNSAYNAGNATAIAGLLAEDAVWMPPGEPAVVGRSAIERRYAAQFANSQSSFALNPGEIRLLADLAWLRGSYRRVDTPMAGGPSTMITGKYLMTFSRVHGDWKIVNDSWNADETPQQVDARIALAGIRSLAEWRLRDVANMLRLIADTEQAKSGVWENMTGILQNLAATDISANAIWFVRPDGFYYSVEFGYTGLNLSDRPYFPGLMAGQSVSGALVISKSTGKRSVIIAEPVRVVDQVIGGVRVSYSVDQFSLEIDRAMPLPPAAVFYALDMNGQTALHRDPSLMFEYPSRHGLGQLAVCRGANALGDERHGRVRVSRHAQDRLVREVPGPRMGIRPRIQ